MMTKYDKLVGTYSARMSVAGNVILKNQYCSLTLKPELLRSFIGWLHDNCSKEQWLPSDLAISTIDLLEDREV